MHSCFFGFFFSHAVANGFYEVRLHFAEIYVDSPGSREFNVIVEGKTVLVSHDIYATVGPNTADVETIVTEVTDGLLTISFEHVTENPKVRTLS